MMKHAETDSIVMHCRLDLRISQGLLEQVLALDPSQKDILVSDWCDASARFILGSAESTNLWHDEMYRSVHLEMIFTRDP